MLRLRTAFLASLIALVAGTGGHSATILTANITTDQEVPPTTNNLTNSSTGLVRPTPSGTATFSLDTTNPNAPFMTFTAMISNIDVTGTQTPNDANDNLVAAHIHANETVVPGNGNAPVVWGFFGSPFNDNNPNDSPNAQMVVPFATGVGGMFSGKWDAPEGNGTTLTAQLANILAGHAYINFHTMQNQGGEIRGFLTVVPEPSSIVLLGNGAIAVIGCGWWSRKRTR